MSLTLRIPRELVSPNKWNGRHWRVKHRISQEWEQEISLAMIERMNKRGKPSGMDIFGAFVGPRKWLGVEVGRVRVEVTRETPGQRNFIRDDDNLRFCVKPLLDALRRQGYIRDDSRKWIELPTPEQKVSGDGKHWTVVSLSKCEGEV